MVAACGAVEDKAGGHDDTSANDNGERHELNVLAENTGHGSCRCAEEKGGKEVRMRKKRQKCTRRKKDPQTESAKSLLGAAALGQKQPRNRWKERKRKKRRDNSKTAAKRKKDEA